MRHPLLRKPTHAVVLLLLAFALPAWPADPAPDNPPPPANQTERPMAQATRQRERLQMELQRLEQEGKADEAARVRERLETLEQRLNQARLRQPRPMDRPDPDRNNPEFDQRRQHLQIAIDHLHAAGLHEPAEQLARQLEQMHPPEPDRPGRGPQARPMMEIERLNAEMNELRRSLQELREQLEQLRRNR